MLLGDGLMLRYAERTTIFATDNAGNRSKAAFGKTLESSSAYNISGASGNLMSSTTAPPVRR